MHFTFEAQNAKIVFFEIFINTYPSCDMIYEASGMDIIIVILGIISKIRGRIAEENLEWQIQTKKRKNTLTRYSDHNIVAVF